MLSGSLTNGGGS